MLDPRLLRSFLVLAEELHFGRAAERLHLAQPALSQQLRRLEQQVGAELFVRSSRAVELTNAGRAMLEPAGEAVRAAEQAERAVREVAQTSAHPLKIGVCVYIDDVVPTLSEYASEHPEISLWVSRMHEQQGQEMLGAGQLDAFLGFTPPVDAGDQAKVRAVDVAIEALVGPGFPVEGGVAVSLRALREVPITIASREHERARFAYWVEILSEGAGEDALTLREIAETGPLAKEAIVEEIRERGAAGFGPPATLADFGGDLRVVPFDPPIVVPTYVSWRPGRSKLLDAFVEHFGAIHHALVPVAPAAPGADAPQPSAGSSVG